MISEIGSVYPWLTGSWANLIAYVHADRMPHAMLITGRRGLGKRLLAKAFGQRLLCRGDAGEFACGRCAACRLVAAGTHPDLLTIEPEESGKSITVDAIREMIGVLSLKPHYGGHRVVILVPAHQMNRYAANCLLKTLEEPASQTLFLLLTEMPENLPVTIRSRCHRVSVPTPPRSAVVDWLRQCQAGDEAEILCSLAQGAPFRALELLGTPTAKRRREVFDSWLAVAWGRQDPVAVAASWEKSAAEEVVVWVRSWVEDIIRLRSAPGTVMRNSPDLQDALRTFVGTLDLVKLFEYLDLSYRAQRLLAGQVNRQFLLEELAIRWSRLAMDP